LLNNKILVIDDEEIVIESILEDLKGMGFKFISAANGKDGLTKYEEEKPILVILDLRMPGMNGVEFLENLRIRHQDYCSVIALTGHGDGSDIRKCFDLGISSFIRKPYNIDVLRGTIRNAIKLKQVQQELIGEIAERKKITNNLRKKEEELQAIIDNSPAVIYLKDTQGNYILINKQFETLFNISNEQIIGKTDFDIFSKKIAEAFQENDKKVLKAKIPIEFEEIASHGEGLHTYISLKFPLVNTKGEIYGVCGISTDITDRIKMEKALIQSEKLKSIGTITAGISHEFNNILAVISGNVQLLAETYNDHRELTDALCTIDKAVNDGAEISSNMLKFTKTRQDTKKFVSSDIREMIEQSLEFTMPRWKSMAQIKGINYQIDKEGMKEVPSLMCNPTEISEIFINVITNALDAMPEGGSISFSTWDKDGVVFVKITDTGEGMSEDVKKNIFDPFFTTKNPVGTGLGMSTAYGIVTRHSGRIDVESEVGKGSTFTLQFPSTTNLVTPKTTPEQETKDKDLSILVVDDEEEICNVLDDFLSKSGNKVKVVDNGADAMELINSEYFDLALCDIAMPKVFGYDVIKALNHLEKRPKIGIITGWGEKLKPIDEEGIKVDFILKKPFNLLELTKHINDVMNSG
jgi:PAS domain S-box-containing protein